LTLPAVGARLASCSECCSILRYLLSGLAQRITDQSSFPIGTVIINLTGCFVIGLLSQLAESRGVFTSAARTIVFIGILGGYTTFSTFSSETINLFRSGQGHLAVLNIIVQVLGGLVLVWAGRTAGQLIWR
jgi:CrcB protein